jgi:cardiolipin synthase
VLLEAVGGTVRRPGLEALLALIGLAYLLLTVVLLLAALLRKREPAAALGWSLAIIFLPVVGPLLFLLFGVNRLPRRLRRKIRHRADFKTRFTTPSQIRRAGGKPYQDGPWGDVGRMVEQHGEAPRRHGNTTRLLSDGADAFAAMSDAVEAAVHHIHIEMYIFRYDDLGKRAIEQLKRKLQQGVEVRLIVDAIGTIASARLLRRIRKSGGEGASFLPLGIFGKRVSFNLRNHRKLMICDGKTAFFGGLNVGEEYLGRRGRKRTHWFDLHMQLDGPAVQDVQRVFVEDWDFCTGTALDSEDYFPALESAGTAPVQIVSGGPDVEHNAIRDAFLLAFARARKHILVATPYFVPDKALLDALRIAALQGVEVCVVTQHPPPDNYLCYFAAFAYFEELLQCGVHVYGYKPGVMHAKAIAVDGEFAMMGSANLDNRSMFLDFELMAMFDGATEVQAIEEQIRGLTTQSTPYTLEGIAARRWPARLATAGARLLAPIL